MFKYRFKIHNLNKKGVVHAWTQKGAIAKLHKKYGDDITGRVYHEESWLEVIVGGICVFAMLALLPFLAIIF